MPPVFDSEVFAEIRRMLMTEGHSLVKIAMDTGLSHEEVYYAFTRILDIEQGTSENSCRVYKMLLEKMSVKTIAKKLRISETEIMTILSEMERDGKDDSSSDEESESDEESGQESKQESDQECVNNRCINIRVYESEELQEYISIFFCKNGTFKYVQSYEGGDNIAYFTSEDLISHITNVFQIMRIDTSTYDGIFLAIPFFPEIRTTINVLTSNMTLVLNSIRAWIRIKQSAS